MCVEEVKTLYSTLRTVIKHFELSVKNKEKLDECMEILGMTPIHLLSWCSTRMAHFLEACVRFNKMLVPVYDAMFTLNIKKEERDALFTVKNLFIIQLMHDVRDVFTDKYLRKVDKSNQLVSSVFHLASQTADSISGHSTPKSDAFSRNLDIDGKGNTTATLTIGEENHQLLLNHHSKSQRFKSKEETLNNIQESLEDLKARILDNISSNIKDQCGQDSKYYCWSGLNLEDRTLSLEDRISRLGDIFASFSTDKRHLVSEYSNSKETKTKPALWNGYKVYHGIKNSET